VTAFVNVTNEAFSVEFKLNSVLECQINGRFGYIGPPTNLVRDIAVKTKGVKRILQKKPSNLPVFFSDSILQITIYNTKYPSDGFLDPLVLTLSCPGKIFGLPKTQVITFHCNITNCVPAVAIMNEKIFMLTNAIF
jgi:hypothetical protein